MKKIMALIIISIIFFSCTGSKSDQALSEKVFSYNSEKGNSLEIIIQDKRISTSDNIHLQIKLYYDSQFFPKMPDWNELKDSMNILEIKNSPVEIIEGDRFRRDVDLHLDNLLPGEYLLNPLEFQFFESGSEVDSIISDYIPLKVESNLVEGVTDLIDDVEPWHMKKNYFIPLVFLFFLILILFVVIYKAIHFYRLKKISQIDFQIPYEMRIQQCSTDNPVQFYSRLSGIMKEYLDNTLFLGVQSQTTEEFIEECKGSEMLEEWLMDQLFSFFKRADKISFDKVTPDALQIEGDIKFCLEFIKFIDKKNNEENPI